VTFPYTTPPGPKGKLEVEEPKLTPPVLLYLALFDGRERLLEELLPYWRGRTDPSVAAHHYRSCHSANNVAGTPLDVQVTRGVIEIYRGVAMNQVAKGKLLYTPGPGYRAPWETGALQLSAAGRARLSGQDRERSDSLPGMVWAALKYLYGTGEADVTVEMIGAEPADEAAGPPAGNGAPAEEALRQAVRELD
jgi:hypothetical protein